MDESRVLILTGFTLGLVAIVFTCSIIINRFIQFLRGKITKGEFVNFVMGVVVTFVLIIAIVLIVLIWQTTELITTQPPYPNFPIRIL